MHGIGIFLATQPRCGETVADLNTVDRIDAHASRRQFAVELGVKRRAPAGRNAGRDTFDHSAQRRTILACAIDQLLPTAGSLRIGTEAPIIANLSRLDIAEVDGVAPDFRPISNNLTFGDEQSSQSARRQATGRVPRALPSPAPNIPTAH